MAILVPQIKEGGLDVVQFIPQECFQNHMEEQMVSVHGSQIEEDNRGRDSARALERIPERLVSRSSSVRLCLGSVRKS